MNKKNILVITILFVIIIIVMFNFYKLIGEKKNSFTDLLKNDINIVEISKNLIEFPRYTRLKSESKYNRPYIPLGFKYKEGSWDTGLVIENEIDKNEFVWIPVKENKGNFEDEKYYYKKRNFKVTYKEINEVEDDFEYPLTYEQKLADDLVEKYGGFYIGRYEATTENERNSPEDILEKLTIQPLKHVYNYVTYYQARDLANNLYPISNETDYISTLTTGKQWDTVCMFLGKEYADNSINKGNYSKKLNKTAVNGYKIKNIYDIAGNCFEWTNEKVKKNSNRIFRGGFYDVSCLEYPAGYRGYVMTTHSCKGLSFRVSLYIK